MCLCLQFKWRLLKRPSQVFSLHFALKKRAIIEEIHEKQEQVYILVLFPFMSSCYRFRYCSYLPKLEIHSTVIISDFSGAFFFSSHLESHELLRKYSPFQSYNFLALLNCSNRPTIWLSKFQIVHVLIVLVDHRYSKIFQIGWFKPSDSALVECCIGAIAICESQISQNDSVMKTSGWELSWNKLIF